jgi:beta-N-acetylhexosaminidase
MEEGRAVASATPMLSGASLHRAKAAAATIRPPQPFDVQRGERELAALNAELGVS